MLTVTRDVLVEGAPLPRKTVEAVVVHTTNFGVLAVPLETVVNNLFETRKVVEFHGVLKPGNDRLLGQTSVTHDNVHGKIHYSIPSLMENVETPDYINMSHVQVPVYPNFTKDIHVTDYRKDTVGIPWGRRLKKATLEGPTDGVRWLMIDSFNGLWMRSKITMTEYFITPQAEGYWYKSRSHVGGYSQSDLVADEFFRSHRIAFNEAPYDGFIRSGLTHICEEVLDPSKIPSDSQIRNEIESIVCGSPAWGYSRTVEDLSEMQCTVKDALEGMDNTLATGFNPIEWLAELSKLRELFSPLTMLFSKKAKKQALLADLDRSPAFKKKARKKALKAAVQDAAGSTLGFHWGLMPAVQDARSLGELMGDFIYKLKHLSRRQPRARRRTVFITEQNEAIEKTYCFKAKLKTPWCLPSGFHLKNVWDLVPYSHLVDWFLNIEDLLEWMTVGAQAALLEINVAIDSLKLNHKIVTEDRSSLGAIGTLRVTHYDRNVSNGIECFKGDFILPQWWEGVDPKVPKITGTAQAAMLAVKLVK
jgi:hypothetical protein